jgi:hypothetical protein
MKVEKLARYPPSTPNRTKLMFDPCFSERLRIFSSALLTASWDWLTTPMGWKCSYLFKYIGFGLVDTFGIEQSYLHYRSFACWLEHCIATCYLDTHLILPVSSRKTAKAFRPAIGFSSTDLILLLLSQLNNLVGNLGKSNVVTYKKQLIVPVLGYLLAADIDGAEGVREVFPASGIKVGGRLIEKGDPGADSLKESEP